MSPDHRKLGDHHSGARIQKMDAQMIRARAMASVSIAEMNRTVKVLAFVKFNPADRAN